MTIGLFGYEPYGGRGMNPASQAVRALDGKAIAGRRVAGVTFPVVDRGLRGRIEERIEALRPTLILGVGLWPGEAMIRLERAALNVCDYEIPDNEGRILKGTPVSKEGTEALISTLPLKRIVTRLIDAGIPARISNSAGTFLCNSMMYICLEILQKRGARIPCGFVHLPYLPEQVAQMLAEMRKEQKMELHQRADLASMELSTMIRAIEICLETVALPDSQNS